MGRQPAGLGPRHVHSSRARAAEVLIIELLTGHRGTGWYDRHVKLPNFYGVMAQVVAAWCRQLGAAPTYRTYTGNEPLEDLVRGEWKVVFISSYTRTADAAYALALHFASRDAVTVLGGPHALAYPADALRIFDYVVGLTDVEVVRQILEERLVTREGLGQWLSAARHPPQLPSLRERAPFLRTALASTQWLHTIPMLSSLGCPYSCAFCSDAETPFQPLDLESLEEDIRFAGVAFPGALLFWHDPTFGVRFDATLSAIERGRGSAHIRFGAETSLSLLTGDRPERLARANFVAMLPGIEQWGQPDPKVGFGNACGRDKLELAVSRVTELLRWVPYVQVNFIFGLDWEQQSDYDLTAEFVKRVPGAWPNFNVITAYGEASPLSTSLLSSGRQLPVPYSLLDQKTCPNIRMPGDALQVMLARLLALAEMTFGVRHTLRRIGTGRLGVRLINLLRARGHDQRQRLAWYRQLHAALTTDADIRAFFAGVTPRLPALLRRLARDRTAAFRPLLPLKSSRWLETGTPRFHDLSFEGYDAVP
jgi:hypothetical protein